MLHYFPPTHSLPQAGPKGQGKPGPCCEESFPPSSPAHGRSTRTNAGVFPCGGGSITARGATFYHFLLPPPPATARRTSRRHTLLRHGIFPPRSPHMPRTPRRPAGPVHARFSRLHPIFVKFGIYGSPLSPLKTSHVWRHVSTVGEELFVSLHGYTAAETSVKAFGRHDGDDPPVNLDQYAVHSAEPCPGEESYLVLDFGCLSLQGGRFSDLSTWGSF